jgi:hypothetical protein
MTEVPSINYVDASELDNQQTLWRRILPDQWVIDKNSGSVKTRPSSAAFENCKDGDPMSSFWEELHRSKGLDEKHVLYKHAGCFVAAFNAGLARNLKQVIHLDPIENQDDPGDNHPAHVLVVGDKPKKAFGRNVAKACTWVAEPTQADVDKKLEGLGGL